MKHLRLSVTDFLKHGRSHFPPSSVQVKLTLAGWPPGPVEKIGDRITEVAQSPLLGRVSVLALPYQQIGPKGAAALARSPHLVNMTGLDLTWNDIKEEGAEALAACPRLAQLRSLYLLHNYIHDAGVKALATSRYINKLEQFDLGWNYIRARGVKYLAESANFRGLKVLNLVTNRVGKLGVEALANSANLKHVAALNLGGDESPPKEKSFAALASSPFLTRLKTLELEANEIGDAGLIKLFQSPNLVGITHLNVNGNKMTLTGLRTLLQSEFVRRLRSLNVGWNRKLGLAGARLLSATPELADLRDLNVCFCEIPAEGISALLSSPRLRKLKTLDIEGNTISERDRSAYLQRFGKSRNGPGPAGLSGIGL
jgi:Ran GTPase-activating protein (RanGAP) involved in mRNA processing and transport